MYAQTITGQRVKIEAPLDEKMSIFWLNISLLQLNL